ncbi:response regulator transcription factor [Sulfurovum sp. zt1-1]|uniref:Response regulator transcription factor n=1 Tax=Sulfurovum zhangzhouensis TaxID=3019067 RepID=A0ABT7QVL5_9BACT|nr:response regulator transcription factor [Sulfurovum zhangzhouensis]MDM5270579.1 response regulator transcription factor [Sulfurovum zhangzhouensis]
MNILLIEDDLDIQELLKDYLKNYNFFVFAYDNPIQALQELTENNNYDMVVLDLMLPRIDGFEVCKRIRAISNIPIIISSARGNLGDKVAAFEYGADDYLAKPYEPKELIIRINAILRRTSKQISKKRIGEFEIDEDKMEISQEDHVLSLTKIEYEIFLFLLDNPNKVLSRESIAQHLGNEHTDRAIDMHISNIRNKIFDDPKAPKYIKSIWGIGYKFIG